MEAAAVQEVQGESDVHVAEKHQDVALLPRVGADVQAPATGKLLVHGDQGVVGEALLSVAGRGKPILMDVWTLTRPF